MKINAWFRQVHRWLAIAFTLGVIVNFIALGGGEEPDFWTVVGGAIIVGSATYIAHRESRLKQTA